MNKLKQLTPTKPFLVCIDSDGCVFDSMELKHKECFTPATVNIWNLQGVSKYVRETADFVNLYSNTRGMNRFPALVITLELLKKRPEVIEREVKIPCLDALTDWIKSTRKLSGIGLQEFLDGQENPHPILVQTLKWSKEVDSNIEHIVRGVKPFPYVHQALKQVKEIADIVIVSSTPYETIQREWKEQGMLKYLHGIAGQEQGTKAECIRILATKYDKSKILMIGDAYGDRNASDQNNVSFYPIIPSKEVQSWKDFCETAFDLFIQNTYDNDSNKYYNSFRKILKETPDWAFI